MAQPNTRYQQMQWYMTYALIADTGLFLLYLVFAGFGVIWLKVITAILTALISLICLAFLYMSKELLRPRSLWMTAASAAILVCLLFSLILNFPSPNKYKQTEPDDSEKNAAVSIWNGTHL